MNPSAPIVRTEWHGDTPVAAIEGEVDAAGVGDVAARLRRALSNELSRLVVDLTSTSYIDSAGINLLFALGEEMRARQQALHLVVPAGSPIARMLSITSIDRTFPTHPALADALGGG